MRHFLAGLMAVIALPAMAQAPSPPAPAAAPQAAQAQAGPAPQGSVFSPSRAAIATAATGVVPPSGAGVPQGLPGLPGTPPAAMPMPVNPNISQPTNSAGEQEVPAVFVGRVNGTSVYRATGGGYLFDKAKRPKVVPKETGSIADSAAANAQTAATPAKK